MHSERTQRAGRQRVRTRSRGQSGSTMIELAFTLLPTLALLLAIVDFTIPVFLQSLFNHAVRAGVRYGITYQTKSGLSHSQSIKSVVQDNAAGFLAGEDGLSKVQVRYYSPATFQEVTGPNANSGGNIVEVRITGFTWTAIAPLMRSKTGFGIAAASADRLETLPRGTPKPAP